LWRVHRPFTDPDRIDRSFASAVPRRTLGFRRAVSVGAFVKESLPEWNVELKCSDRCLSVATITTIAAAILSTDVAGQQGDAIVGYGR
jgi:hypothetical protein